MPFRKIKTFIEKKSEKSSLIILERKKIQLKDSQNN